VNQQQLVNCLGLAGVVMVLVGQPVRADTVKVTAIELNPTSEGIELVLRTTDGKPLQVFTSSYGKTFVANIINTQLQLPDSNTFRQEKPLEGIAAVTVTSLNANSIRIIVTGEAELPKGKVTQSDASSGLRQRTLVFSLTAPADTTAQKPIPTPEVPEAVEPESPTKPEEMAPEEDDVTPQEPAETEQPEEDEAGGEEEIEVAVTATRTEEELEDVPRSVTVITREQIEEQTRFTRNLSDILANTVPGFGPPTNRTNTFGQTLRGRDISVLIDGIPQNTNLQSIPAQLTTIDPEAIERIEVVRGPNAIYGAQATGGLMNIITRRPSEDRLTSTTEIGLNNSLTNAAESFGYNLQHSISGTEDQLV
jgi:iron complex outermembrane receptor protein